MPNRDELTVILDRLLVILDRILENQGTADERLLLSQSLQIVGNVVKLVSQDGSFTIDIGQVTGGEIHIGDRVYQGASAQVIEEALRAALREARRVERPSAERQLLSATKNNIEIRLSQSLHNDVLINLRKDFQLKQVEQLWRPEIIIGNKPPETISPSTSILEVFDRVKGKLLILGSPGSGKTTTMLELAQKLVERATTDANYPIPVVFNLSSWNGRKQSLQSWIIEQLKDFPSSNISKNLLEQGKLLPILDGLDELEAELQADCITAVNQELLRGKNPLLYLVVCSRSREYANHQIKLSLNGAVRLQKLTNTQIENYLSTVGQSQLWQSISQEDKLLALVRTPLILNIAILTHKNISLSRWQSLSSTEDQLEYLLSAYIRRMLNRPILSNSHKRYELNTQKTQRWLTFLAKQMRQKAQTEFLIESMSPKCLENQTQKWIYSLLVNFIPSPLLWLFLWLVWLYNGWIGLLVTGLLITFLLISLSSAQMIPKEIEAVETLSWSYARAKDEAHSYVQNLKVNVQREVQNLRSNMRRVLAAENLGKRFLLPMLFILIILFISIIFTRNIVIMKILLFAVAISVILIFLNLLAVSLKSGFILRLEMNERKIPNQGMRSSAVFAGINGLVGAVAGLFLAFSLEFLEYDSQYHPSTSLGEDPRSWGTGTVGKSLFEKVAESVSGKVSESASELTINEPRLDFIHYFFHKEHDLLHIVLGVLVGGIFGWVISSAGKACIQHFTLRLMLYCSGLVPWNYALFLNYCTERRILQRIGGRYQFIHKLLQDHFAAIPIRKYEKND